MQPKPVISIDSRRTAPPPPEPPPSSPAARRKFRGNQHTRRDFLLRFLAGTGLWKVAREHPETPLAEIEREVRDLAREGWHARETAKSQAA